MHYGLNMDSKGRVAQRSYADTVHLQFKRDQARGLIRPVTEIDPLITVLGADGTGIGKRSLMHVACSIAPSYRDGISVENEKNVNTVATSVTRSVWRALAGLWEARAAGSGLPSSDADPSIDAWDSLPPVCRQPCLATAYTFSPALAVNVRIVRFHALTMALYFL